MTDSIYKLAPRIEVLAVDYGTEDKSCELHAHIDADGRLCIDSIETFEVIEND